jgi:hypothetical protein
MSTAVGKSVKETFEGQLCEGPHVIREFCVIFPDDVFRVSNKGFKSGDRVLVTVERISKGARR